MPEGELPDMSEIETYDGIVITGSRHSAVDGVKSMRWMKHLKQFLERVARLKMRRNNRKCASELGAHVLCEALGGKVRRRNSINSNEEEELDVIGKFTCEFIRARARKRSRKNRFGRIQRRDNGREGEAQNEDGIEATGRDLRVASRCGDAHEGGR